MRPDVAALRELDALVRHLGDQLAGYRRRALAAEARVRDLEAALQASRREGDALRLAADAATGQAGQIRAERDALAAELAEVRVAVAAAAVAASAPRHGAEAATAPDVTSRGSPGAAGNGREALLRENEALRARLAEARDRTRQLMDRVRFLRQQLLHGVDQR